MGRSNENVRAREKEKGKSQVEKKSSGGGVRARRSSVVILFHTKAPATLKVFACKNVILLILRATSFRNNFQLTFT